MLASSSNESPLLAPSAPHTNSSSTTVCDQHRKLGRSGGFARVPPVPEMHDGIRSGSCAHFLFASRLQLLDAQLPQTSSQPKIRPTSCAWNLNPYRSHQCWNRFSLLCIVPKDATCIEHQPKSHLLMWFYCNYWYLIIEAWCLMHVWRSMERGKSSQRHNKLTNGNAV